MFSTFSLILSDRFLITVLYELYLRCIAPISICHFSFAVLNISHGNWILFNLHKQGVSEDKVLSSLETLSIL